jgi:hypothetical protein
MAHATEEYDAPGEPFHATVQCSARVHAFYGEEEQAEAVARAKSRNGLFFVAEKCPACSGWRLRRLS